jgi:hypothetical protein
LATLIIELAGIADIGVFFVILANRVDIFHIAELDRRILVVVNVFVAAAFEFITLSS